MVEIKILNDSTVKISRSRNGNGGRHSFKTSISEFLLFYHVDNIPYSREKNKGFFEKKPGKNRKKSRNFSVSPGFVVFLLGKKGDTSTRALLTRHNESLSVGKRVLASHKESFSTVKEFLAVGKNILATPKEFLSTGKTCLTSRKNVLASRKESLASGKNVLSAPKEFLATVKNVLSTPKEFLAARKNVLALDNKGLESPGILL